MYYTTYELEDYFNSFEVIGQKGESDAATRQKALAKHFELCKIPGVHNIKTYVQTIDVKYSNAENATVYTFFCDIDQIAFARMCAIKNPEKLKPISPKDWIGKPFINSDGSPTSFYFVQAKYREAAELQKKAAEICKKRKVEYSGNLLQVFSVFHA